MRALSIAWKDIRHVYRDLAALAMMFIAPLVLAAALGAAFGAGDDFTIAAVKTVVVNQDEGTGTDGPIAGAAITAALSSPDLADLVLIDESQTAEAARAAVDNGDAAVAVIIPSGLTAGLTGTESTTAEVEIYKDPALSVGPSIVAAVVQSVIHSLNGAQAAAIAAAGLGTSLGINNTEELNEIAAGAARNFAHAIQTEPPVTIDTRDPVTPGAETQKRPNVASQVLLGMMLFFMLFGASTPARSVLDEHRQGTLPRLFTTPTPRSVILGGKYIAVFFVVLLQSVILLFVGWLLLGADWGETGPVIALTLCGALVASSLGLLTVSFAKTQGQAGAVSAAIFVFLALISGNFFGTTNVGGTFATVRRISPLGWLLEAWGNILYGGSWESIALPVVVVLAFALVFFGLATFFFRRRYA